MDREILNDVRRAVASGINRPLLVYWTTRLEELKTDLMHASDLNFKEIKGRALEAEAFIKILSEVKE